MSKIPVSLSGDTGCVIEWAPFVLKPDVQEKEILDAAGTVQSEFLEMQKGFIRRELLKGKQNQWVDLVYWATEEDAQRATHTVHQSSACLKYFGMMEGIDSDDPEGGVFHYRQKRIWD